MTARVIVVDDVDANVKLLEARLTARVFRGVHRAEWARGAEYLRAGASRRGSARHHGARHGRFRGVRAVEHEPRTHHIPVIMVTALDQPSDRVKGLEAGANDS
jgi:two-component system, cell cycle response regulator